MFPKGEIQPWLVAQSGPMRALLSHFFTSQPEMTKLWTCSTITEMVDHILTVLSTLTGIRGRWRPSDVVEGKLKLCAPSSSSGEMSKWACLGCLGLPWFALVCLGLPWLI